METPTVVQNKAGKLSKTKVGAVLLALAAILGAVGNGLINGFSASDLTTVVNASGALLVVLGIRDAIGK